MIKDLVRKLFSPIGLLDAVVLLCVVTLTLQVFPDFARDPGVGWHLKSGEFLWLNKVVPQVDPFLASTEPRPWVSDQWLSDLALYSLFRVGSWPTVYLGIISLIAVTYFSLLYKGVATVSGQRILAVAGLVVAFKLGQVHFILRPVVISFFFFTLTTIWLYKILRAAREGDCVLGNWGIVGFMLAFMLWANLHPSFVLGLTLIGVLLLSGFLDKFFFQDGWLCVGNLRQRLLLLLFLCLMVTLINPYFTSLHQSILSLGQSEYFMNLHEEWRSPDFKEFSGSLVKITLAVLAMALWVDRDRKLGWGAFELLTVAMFYNMSFNAVRVFPFLGIVVAIPFTEAIALLGKNLFQRLGLWERFSLHFRRLEEREARSNAGVLAMILLGAWLWYGVFDSGVIGRYKGPWGPPADRFPYGAMKFLVESQGKGQGHEIVVAATPDWGGFITFWGEGKVKAVIDDRNTLVGESFHKSFMQNVRTLADWKGYLGKIKATHVMLSSKDSAFEQYLEKSKELPMVYKDSVAAVFKYE